MDIAAPAAEVIESIVPLGGLFLLVVVAGAVLELVGRLINRFKRKPARGRGSKYLVGRSASAAWRWAPMSRSSSSIRPDQPEGSAASRVALVHDRMPQHSARHHAPEDQREPRADREVEASGGSWYVTTPRHRSGSLRVSWFVGSRAG